jgi:hypothetical protein
MAVALILGAGWSYCAGLPLANQLFDRLIESYDLLASVTSQRSPGAWGSVSHEAIAKQIVELETGPRAAPVAQSWRRTADQSDSAVFSPRHYYGTSRPIDALGIVCDAEFP